jgi:hypothetical protein
MMFLSFEGFVLKAQRLYWRSGHELFHGQFLTELCMPVKQDMVRRQDESVVEQSA